MHHHRHWPGTIHFLMAANAVLVEEAANGPAVIQTLRRKIRGLLPRSPVAGAGDL